MAFWKLVEVEEGGLWNPYSYLVFTNEIPTRFRWSPGVVKAEGQLKGDLEVRGGALHLYRTEAKAQAHARALRITGRKRFEVVEVKAKAENLVGANAKEAAFTEVELSYREWERARGED